LCRCFAEGAQDRVQTAYLHSEVVHGHHGGHGAGRCGEWGAVWSLDGKDMEKSTYGLKPSQLGRLLAASAGALESREAMAGDQANETLLQQYLSRRLSSEPSFEEALLSAGGRSVEEVRPLLDRSMREVLLDPECDLAVLKAVKDHSKRRSAMVTSGSETLTTTALYYAAIAAALVYHGERITTYSTESLERRFSLLAERPWMDSECKALFVRAAEWCRRNRTASP